MRDLILLEVCPNCKGHLAVRESISNDNNKLYLVKWCPACGNHPVEELARLYDEAENAELRAEVERLQAENAKLRKALTACEGVKSFMTLPPSYWNDEWSDERESRLRDAEKEYKQALAELDKEGAE